MVSKVVSTAKTRATGTTQYSAGDVVDAGTGTGITFSEVVRTPGATGVITGVNIIDSANQATKAQLELWLFTAALGAYDNDNAAFTPTDAELATLVDIIALPQVIAGDATSGAGGNCVYKSGPLTIPFQCASNSRDLYGVLVARNAYTPVDSEIFTPMLQILQD